MNQQLNISLHLPGQWVKLLNQQEKLLALGLNLDMGKQIRLGFYLAHQGKRLTLNIDN
jgi:hypothetical protein